MDNLNNYKNFYLSHKSLFGQIPESLGNFSSLIILNLYSHDLNENLPESLGQVFNLESLIVADNSFTGVVSERNLMSLSKLKNFSVSSPDLIFNFDPEWVPPFQLLFVSRICWGQTSFMAIYTKFSPNSMHNRLNCFI
ncbi:unnamed protein product [Sphenostylis stenocarpa]|uniref:Uncharacterized protein n=1 Tax=Sphenostylis stenocarpa TaxID=92480 RepID=A0AA87B7B1_9FABA|nr:unnamed protein product [Sphenostylis stenocarpa]